MIKNLIKNKKYIIITALSILLGKLIIDTSSNYILYAHTNTQTKPGDVAIAVKNEKCKWGFIDDYNLE